MNFKRTLLSFTLVASLIANASYANEKTDTEFNSDLQKIVDDYYKKYSNIEKFTAISASVLIPQNKKTNLDDIKTVVAGTIGFAPLNQLINPDNLFDTGSITKSFTAVILLQLQTEGKLSLDDPLGKWLPQYKNWSKVTLRQLLNMTSSIPNYSEDPEFTKMLLKDLSKVWSDEELLSYAHPEKPLTINKNNVYEYCNSNYILAALVIEKVTNDTYSSQLQKRILGQKGYLNRSYYLAGPDSVDIEKTIQSQRVHGYFYDKKTKKSVDTITNNLTWGGPAGAIVANTNDVVRWVQWLYHGTLIAPQYREQILTELKSIVSLKTGHPITTVTEQDPAGFGLGVAFIYDKDSNQRFWFYEGSTLGFRVMYIWSPCNDITTAVALNSKGGEGDPNSEMKDHIREANLNLYNAIIKNNPQLNCKNS
jgi:D-alanyl-D-alanine carboxypeptidase